MTTRKRGEYMPDAIQEPLNPVGITERRVRHRFRPVSLVFVELPGGIPCILSDFTEDGLSLSAALPLPDGPYPNIRIQLPDSPVAIETGAEVVWKSQSGRSAGLRFVGPADAARARIRAWISSAECGNLSSEIRDPTFQRHQQIEVIDQPNLAKSLVEASGLTIAGKDFSQGTECSAAPSIAGEKIESEGPEPQRVESSADVKGRFVEFHSYAGPDRRAQPRLEIRPFALIEIGSQNGGIAVNLNEGGVALSSSYKISDSLLKGLRLQLPRQKDWIEIEGEIAWISESKKSVGIRFGTLREDARKAIQKWMSEEQSGEPSAALTPRPEQIQKQIPEAPHGLAENAKSPDGWTGLARETAPPIPSALPDIHSEDGYSHHPAVSLSSASKWAPVYLIVFRMAANWRRPVGRLFASASRRPQVAIPALIALVALLSFALGYREAIRSAWISQLASIGRKPAVVSEPHKPPAELPIERSSAFERTQVAETHMPSASAPINVAQEQTTTPGTLSHSSVESERRTFRKDAPEPAQRAENIPERSVSARQLAEVSRQPEAGNNSAPTSKSNAPEIHAAAIIPAKPKRAAAQVAFAGPAPNVSISSSTSGTKDELFSSLASKLPDVPKNLVGLVAIETSPYPSIRYPAGRKSKKSKEGVSLSLGHPISRTEPAYPEAAKLRGIEGDVKIHATFGRNGSVSKLVVVNGPPLLAEAAMSAVRQWRYSKTLVGGEPVEIDEDITIAFHLSSQTAGGS